MALPVRVRPVKFRPWMRHDKDEIEIRVAAAHDRDVIGPKVLVP